MSRTQSAFTLLVVAGLFALSFLHIYDATRDTPLLTRPATPIEQALKAAELTKLSGSGTCFPIAVRDGRIAWLTCAHVVGESWFSMGSPEAKVVVQTDGDRSPVLLTVTHPSIDVAIVWTASNPAKPIVPLPLAPANAVPGDFAILAGFPADAGLWISAGFVASKDEAGDVWSSLPIYYGCSGGPVLVNGFVVGVAKAVHIDEGRQQVITTISAHVPIDSFRDWLMQALTAGQNLK